MHPYGGTPICPRCNKAVYAAEQIMGPGRKLYHKPCLACTSCNKRLDSYNLVEHDQQPFCKTCHVKTFGTVDLRHANLPDRDDVLMSPPRSPARAGTFSPKNPATPLPSNNGAPPLPVRNGTPPVPVFSSRPYSPVRPVSGTVTASQGVDPRLLNHDDDDWDPPSIHTTPAHTGRGAGGLPRTLALNHAMTGPARAESPTKETVLSPLAPMTPTSTGGSGAHIGGTMTVPLSPTRTGTRYGMALGGGRMSSPMSPTTTRMSWAGPGNPSCGKCGKTVYFAEQVKGIGKTWHKNCLRCTECNKLLDSTRLNENEGIPYCNHCYAKFYGPSGSGYALLGKAGG